MFGVLESVKCNTFSYKVYASFEILRSFTSEVFEIQTNYQESTIIYKIISKNLQNTWFFKTISMFTCSVLL